MNPDPYQAHAEVLAAYWGERLRLRRRERGLSQAALAALTQMSQQAIWQFESGRRLPGDRIKLAFAAALGTTPAELFPWPAGRGWTDPWCRPAIS